MILVVVPAWLSQDESSLGISRSAAAPFPEPQEELDRPVTEGVLVGIGKRAIRGLMSSNPAADGDQEESRHKP